MKKQKSLIISGELTNETLVTLAEWLEDNRGQQRRFIILNSEGGDQKIGFAMYDLIKLAKKPITMLGIGQVQSAALLPFLACKNRYCTSNTRFMFHHGSFETNGAEGQREMVGLVNELIADDEAYQNIITQSTNLNEKQMRELITYGYYFGADEAVKLGFVQKII